MYFLIVFYNKREYVYILRVFNELPLSLQNTETRVLLFLIQYSYFSKMIFLIFCLFYWESKQNHNTCILNTMLLNDPDACYMHIYMYVLNGFLYNMKTWFVRNNHKPRHLMCYTNWSLLYFSGIFCKTVRGYIANDYLIWLICNCMCII